MKKLTILLALFLFSCEKEKPQPTEPTCDCKVIEEIEYMSQAGVWYKNPNVPYGFSAETDCDKDGEVIQTWSVQQWDGVQNFRKRLICD